MKPELEKSGLKYKDTPGEVGKVQREERTERTRVNERAFSGKRRAVNA